MLEILLIQTLETNFSEIVSEIHTFSFKKMHFNIFAKWQQFYLGLNVLINIDSEYITKYMHHHHQLHFLPFYKEKIFILVFY